MRQIVVLSKKRYLNLRRKSKPNPKVAKRFSNLVPPKKLRINNSTMVILDTNYKIKEDQVLESLHKRIVADKAILQTHKGRQPQAGLLIVSAFLAATLHLIGSHPLLKTRLNRNVIRNVLPSSKDLVSIGHNKLHLLGHIDHRTKDCSHSSISLLRLSHAPIPASVVEVTSRGHQVVHTIEDTPMH